MPKELLTSDNCLIVSQHKYEMSRICCFYDWPKVKSRCDVRAPQSHASDRKRGDSLTFQ